MKKMLRIISTVMICVGLFAVVIMAILLGANLTLSVVTGVAQASGYAVLSSCIIMAAFILLLASGIAGRVFFYSGNMLPSFVMGWVTLGVDVLAIALGIAFLDLSVQLVVIYEIITVLPVLFLVPACVLWKRYGRKEINSEEQTRK